MLIEQDISIHDAIKCHHSHEQRGLKIVREKIKYKVNFYIRVCIK